MSRRNAGGLNFTSKPDFYNIRKTLNEGWRIEDIPLRVAYYTRVSTDTDDQQNSMENQKSFFEEYINNVKAWTMVRGYYDNGITGTSVKNRKGFMEMYQDALNGGFDLIIVKEVSRFARNTLDCIFYARELKKAGVNIYFKNDMFSYFETIGEDTLNREACNAQKESSRISERVKFGFERSIKKGVVLGNDNIWGYVKDDGKLKIVPHEAEIVQKIFELYRDGYGCRRIGSILHDKYNYTSSTGKLFSYSTISNIIRTEKYKGVYVGGKTQKVELLSSKIMHFDRNEWTVWEDETGDIVPRIISDELWNKCNAIYKERSKKITSDDKTCYSNLYPYSGKIFCGSDGNVYWHRTYKYKSGEKTVWQCKEYCKRGTIACDNPHIYAHELNFVMDNVLKCLFDNKDALWNKLQAIYADIIKTIDYAAEIKAIIGKIETLKKKKSKLLMYNASGDISDAEFLEMNRDISTQTRDLQNEMEHYESVNDSKKTAETMLKLTNEWFNSDKQYTDDRQEELIEKFLESITIYKTDIEQAIRLKIKLKSGITIPAFLRRKQDNSLPQAIHIVSDKLSFGRYKNINQIVPNYIDISYSAEICV